MKSKTFQVAVQNKNDLQDFDTIPKVPAGKIFEGAQKFAQRIIILGGSKGMHSCKNFAKSLLDVCNFSVFETILRRLLAFVTATPY